MHLTLPSRIAGLAGLAYNLWWSWDAGARTLFRELSPALWAISGENPVRLLRALSPGVLETAAADTAFCARYDLVMHRFEEYLHGRRGWFEEAHGDGPTVAYFSAEFGLHHALPIYAGGLGFLAGDHLKECSDLHVPLVGVGLLYGEGYLAQRLGADGAQADTPEPVDRGSAPIEPVLGPDGEPLEVAVALEGSVCTVRAWRAAVGRVPLYLLDTDHPENPPAFRGITRRLYAGDCALRLRQEVVLGVGGRRLLAALGLGDAAVHLNEGHPAFALLELLREAVAAGAPFEEAVRAVRARSVFTTHTPVPAGFDVFDDALVLGALRAFPRALGLSREAFLALGRHPGAPEAGFNMAMLALRLTGAANGVSARHGEVSRTLFAPLWPGLEPSAVPVGSITNGVHLPTWLDPALAALLDRHLSPTCPGWREEHDLEAVWGLVDGVPDRALWEVRLALKARLATRLREGQRRAFAAGAAGPAGLAAGGALLDPGVLTIGFARRFSTYKRADLVFTDPDRLRRILTDPERPVQLVFAGKAHPADEEGRQLLRRVHGFARDPAFEGRIAFMEDYSAASAPDLVRGVDVWLNTPVPPLEASGTSGMKAAMNGVVNCSVLDGWWLEGYDGENGWAFGEGSAEADAAAVYDLLETAIAPRYYDRGPDGVPHAWVELMKASIRTCAPRFSARRMVKEYVDRYYPALRAGTAAARAPAITADEESLAVDGEA
jgi:glycogen phosphorylase